MATTIYPERYLNLLESQSKQLATVVVIEGVSDVLTNVPIYEKVRYGDSGIFYGTPGLVYGALRLKTNVKPYLQVDGNLVIGQKIEPEQGRGGISTLSLNFIDKDGYMSRLISPGVVVDELLGNKAVKIFTGFVNSSFPDDYFVVFRGFVSGTYSSPAKVTLKISDPNFKRKGQVFRTSKTELTAPMTTLDTVATMVRTDGLFERISGDLTGFDSSVTTYLKINDEVMTYTALTSPTTIAVTRGGGASRGTVVAAHASGDTVENSIQLQGNPIDIALKLMLSGWNGPFVSGIPCDAIGNSGDPNIANANNLILVGSNLDTDLEYGLTVGDVVRVAGSSMGNDGSYTITNILDSGGYSNRLLVVSGTLAPESPATGVTLAFRSKYDTLPVGCGLKMKPSEVDVLTHESVRDTFINGSGYQVQLYYTDRQQGKEQIEKEMFLPFGIYSLTRYGRVSCGITKPPIADEKLTFVTPSEIIDPQNIRVERAVDNRRYYNQVVYSYNKDDQGFFGRIESLIDSTSLNLSTVSSPLPIASAGLKSSLGAASVISNRGTFILNRYKSGAVEITMKVFWQVGAVIEVGDVVALQDNGVLKVTNFSDGSRDLGTNLWEVIQRTMNLKDGFVTITLLSQLGFNLSDRYATISPSSLVSTASTTTRVRFKDSFGAQFPGNEKKKWERFTGLPIIVHSPDYTTRYGTANLIGIDPTDAYALLLDAPLGFTPQVDDIIEIGDYPLTNPSAEASKLYKTLFAFIDPTLTVVSGTSQTQFDISLLDAALLIAGQLISVHSVGYSIESPEVEVVSVIGTTVIVDSPLGFIPAAGQQIELVGFIDGGGAYRQI